MGTETAQDSGNDPTTEHVDVLIVGAGISGVGAAYHLTTQRPGTTFVVLDALDGYGGTWRTHTYPGIRSTATSTRSGTGSSRGRVLPSPPPRRSRST